MNLINLNNRVFIPDQNSENGEVGKKTIFVFKQDGRHLTANYSGGDIKSGHILGVMDGNNSAHLLYHCITQKSVLKSGHAAARFIEDMKGCVRIQMDWQWLSGGAGKGTSLYEEINQ